MLLGTGAVQKSVSRVGLENCCSMNVHLQKLASRQPRTSLPIFVAVELSVLESVVELSVVD